MVPNTQKDLGKRAIEVPSRVVIIWNRSYEELDDIMRDAINKYDMWLFRIICNSKESLGYKWAAAHGAPVEFLIENDMERLLDKMAASADLLICSFDGKNQLVRRLIMKFKSLGKHGVVR